MAEAGAEDNGVGPDRTRVTRACDNCKIRRARCRIIPSTAADTNPICFGCRENNLNCSYTAPHRKRGPQPGFRKNTNTQSPVAAQSSTSSGYGQPSTSRRPWEDGPSGSLGTVIASTPQQYDNDKEEVPDVKLPLLGLPSEMVDQLLAVYFTHVHNVWPIIYKPLFNPHTTSPPLLLSILAIASCVSEPYPSASAQSPHGPAVRYDAEKLSLMAEKSLREALEREEIRIDLIQALVIMSLRQTGNGHKESAFMYGGRACLGVLSLGLNLKATGKISQVDGEIRSRVFWNVYVLDKCLAEETGRPYLLPFQRCSVPIPSAQETDELETWPPPPTSSSSSSLPTSVRHIVPRRGYVMSCFQWSCRLGKVFENILDLDNQVKSSEEGDTWDKEYDDWQQSRSMDAHVTELVDQLDRWRKNVPEWLLVDTRAHVSPLPHLVVLSAWYNTAKLLLHSRFTRKRYPLVQPFLHLDQLINTSRTTCSEAAQDSIDLFAHLDRFRLLIQVSSDVIHILSMTTLFEAFDSTNPDERLAHRAKLNFAQCCIWLRDFSASWPSASAHKLFFDGLIQGGLRLTTSDSAETSSADGNGPEGLERIDRDRYRTFGNNLTGIHEHATTSDLNQPTLPDPSYGANGLSTDIFQLPQYYWNHLTTTAESIVPKQPQQPDQTQGVYDQMPVNHMSLMSPTWTGAEGNLHPERSDLPWERVDPAPAQYLPAGTVPAAAAGDMSANVVGGDMADQSQTAIYTALMDYMFQAARSQ